MILNSHDFVFIFIICFMILAIVICYNLIFGCAIKSILSMEAASRYWAEQQPSLQVVHMQQHVK
jgi:hypothetical protein